MLIRVISALLISCGLVIIITVTITFRRFLRDNRHASYLGKQGRQPAEVISLALLYVFIFGFVVGLIDVIRRDVEPIYSFVALIFFLGAIFIFMILRTQIRLHEQSQEQNQGTMHAFINALDMKDEQNRGHSRAVLAITDLFFAYLPTEIQNAMSRPKLLDAAYLHDCGKLIIRDNVLRCKGRLSPEDWDEMRKHPAYGKKILESTCFNVISDWVLYHHEREDGNGYYGLTGEQIPLEAKIIGIANTYASLRTNHSYRPAMSHDKAIVLMLEEGGKQYDAKLLEYFLRIDRGELRAIVEPEQENAPATGFLSSGGHA